LVGGTIPPMKGVCLSSLKFRKHFRLKNLLILNIPNLLDILFEIANSSMKDSFTLNERRENFQNPFFVDKNGID
jgi:hypothetical protein